MTALPEKPPTLADKYFIVDLKDGTRQLIKAADKKELCRAFRHEPKAADKIRYSDLAVAIEQRVYDYQFYFENFIQTSSSDTVAYAQALANLADVFSNDLTLYAINGPDGSPEFPALTTKAAVVSFQELLHGIFQGFTLHTAPNIRVRPICGSTVAQASSGSAEIDYSLINKGAGPLDYLDLGYYNFTWKYESDNVWRIVTWQIINKLDTVLTPAVTVPVPYIPYPSNPPGTCR